MLSMTTWCMISSVFCYLRCHNFLGHHITQIVDAVCITSEVILLLQEEQKRESLTASGTIRTK